MQYYCIYVIEKLTVDLKDCGRPSAHHAKICALTPCKLIFIGNFGPFLQILDKFLQFELGIFWLEWL